jgi:hypothetical protein
MSFSGRLHNIAVRGFLILSIGLAGSVALGQGGTGNDKPVAEQAQQQPEPQPDPQPDPPKDDPTGSLFWKGKLGDADTYRSICDKPKHQSDADLCQQWRSAEASNKQANLAFWQLIASAFGVAGLIATIIYTHRTFRLTAVTAEQQLRAYVTISVGEIRVMDIGDDPHFSAVITLKNSGNTPAYKFRAWVRAEIARFDAIPFQNITTPADGPFSILGPELTAHLNSDWQTVGGMREDIGMGGFRLFVWGQATYETMGKPHTFTFRAWNGQETSGDVDSDPLGDKWGGWVMTPHPSGYEST